MSRRLKVINVVLIAVWCLVLLANSSQAGDQKQLDELLSKIAVYELGHDLGPLNKITDLIRDTQSDPELQKPIEKSFLALLKSDATLQGKQFICKNLSLIGTAESVPTLAEMLIQTETSDMARYALERIPALEADNALLEGLSKTSGKVKIGIINSLGQRGNSGSVEALSKLIYDSDSAIAEAAVAALGKIACSSAAEVLAEAKDKTTGELQLLVFDSYLRCGDNFARQGEKTKACEIYNQLYEAGKPSIIRITSLRGMVFASAENIEKIIADALKENDPQIQAAAIYLIRDIPGAKMTEAAVVELRNLPVTGQVQLLAALSDRGESEALTATVNAAKNGEELVRIAALKAIAGIGNETNVEFLAETAATTKGVEREAARESLYSLRGTQVDKTILASMEMSGPEVKVELIRSLGQRNATSGVEALLGTASDPDGNVRLESIKALREIAGSEHISKLVDLLVSTKETAELKEAEKTIVAVAHKSGSENAAATAVLAKLPSVNEINVRGSLLQVLGKLGDNQALGVLRGALGDSNSEIQIAAIHGLSDWPTAEPAADLLQIARSPSDELSRALALRGFVGLLELESKRSAEETLKMYQEAMKLAANEGEKKMVLSGIANVETAAAIEMAAEYLSDDALQQEAAVAAVKIGQAIYANSPKETKAVLEKVLQTSKDEALRVQAQEVLKKIEELAKQTKN